MLSQPLPYLGSFFVQVFLLSTTRQLLLWKPPLESWNLADTYAATSPLIGQETLSLWIQDAGSESFSTQFSMYKLQVDWHCNYHLFTLLCVLAIAFCSQLYHRKLPYPLMSTLPKYLLFYHSLLRPCPVCIYLASMSYYERRSKKF